MAFFVPPWYIVSSYPRRYSQGFVVSLPACPIAYRLPVCLPNSSLIVHTCRHPCSPHLSPPASSPRRPVNRLAAYSSISRDGEGRREGERGGDNRLSASPNLTSCADMMETVFLGCIPASVFVYYIYRYGLVAQLGEQQLCKLKDAGSSPA